MKPFQLLLVTLLIHTSCNQSIFKYEQKIDQSDDLVFEELSFPNTEEGIQLSGTFIYPKEGYDKIIIIVPGSGADTRHSHFKLAENFLAHNIAVYRFDDRGTGMSKGNFDDTASSLMNDVVCAYDELRRRTELSNKQIGILGHSLGGIASIGAYGKGCDFDFLIQMSTPVANNGAFLTYQASAITDGWSNVKGKSTEEVVNFVEALTEIVKSNNDNKTININAKALLKEMDFKNGRHIVNPVIIDLMKQKHENTYKSCSTPMLYIIGTDDKNVSSENELTALKRLGNPIIEIKLIENVGHYLSDKAATSFYFMNEMAMNEIVNWVVNK